MTKMGLKLAARKQPSVSEVRLVQPSVDKGKLTQPSVSEES